jgi:hypothetical protein
MLRGGRYLILDVPPHSFFNQRMNRTFFLMFFWLGLALSCGTRVSAQTPGGIKVAARAAKISSKGKDEAQIWAYQLSFENGTSLEVTGAKATCRIFLFRDLSANENGRVKADGKMDSFEEDHPLPVLKPRGKAAITTNELSFATGGMRVNPARDILKGIVVRVTDASGKEIGLLVQPPSLAKHLKP